MNPSDDNSNILDLVKKAQHGCQESMYSLAKRTERAIFVYLYRLTLNHSLCAMATKKTYGFYIEYSFAEPRYFVVSGEPVISSGWQPRPSIHFRHLGRANIGWVDGHIGSEKMTEYNGLNEDGLRPIDMDLGWFEPIDNSSFDLK